MYSTIAPLPPGRDDFRVHIGSIYLGEMESNYVATSVVMVRREEAGQALRFSEDLKISQDKECFGRLAKVGLAAYFACETGTQWGHEGPRMTDANTYDRASARLTLLDRIWASDPAFVAQYGDRLEQARQEYRMRRARWLLARGRTREARADLRAAGPCPLSYRMLASLPEPVARGLLKIRRLVRGKNQLVAGGALSC
jgi:hypothetical protein